MVISQTAVLILLTCVLANVEGKHGNNSFTITNWKAFSGFNCLRFLFSLFLPVHVWWVVFYCGYQRRPGWTGVSQPVTATGWPPSGCRTSPHGYKPPGWGTGGPDGWEDTEKISISERAEHLSWRLKLSIYYSNRKAGQEVFQRLPVKSSNKVRTT